MKILITGGAGFIGSHLAEALSAAGHQVTIFDCLRTGKLENLISSHSFIRGDIRDYNLLAAALEGHDLVFHLAALTSVVESMTNIEECIAINVNGLINVLKAAKENGVKKVVFASSAAVYGDAPALPKVETMMPEPLSPYAITKVDGEYYCRLFSSAYGLATVCARFFNVFGERQDPNSAYASAVPIFINNALRGLPITVYGDGTQSRDFIYVKDIVKGLVFLMSSGAGTYNIGYGQSITVNALVAKIQELTGNKNEIQYLPERPGEIKHSYAAVDKIKALGFQSNYSLDNGLIRTIEYYRKLIDAMR